MMNWFSFETWILSLESRQIEWSEKIKNTFRVCETIRFMAELFGVLLIKNPQNEWWDSWYKFSWFVLELPCSNNYLPPIMVAMALKKMNVLNFPGPLPNCISNLKINVTFSFFFKNLFYVFIKKIYLLITYWG